VRINRSALVWPGGLFAIWSAARASGPNSKRTEITVRQSRNRHIARGSCTARSLLRFIDL
jgi:hypothetical protein